MIEGKAAKPNVHGHLPKFSNDRGAPEIRIGATEFRCIGATPPQDHPHIYLDMGESKMIVCPYCSTLFRYDDRLAPDEADPPESKFSE